MGFAPRELGHRDNYRLHHESTVSTTRIVLSQKCNRGGGLGGERSRAKEKLQLRAVESRLFWCQRPSKMKANDKNEDHGIWSHHFIANRWENNGNSDRLYFFVLQNHCGQWLHPQN